MDNSRAQWGSKLGFILAAAGSAIGLGNIGREGLNVCGKELFDGSEFQNFVHDGVPVGNLL